MLPKRVKFNTYSFEDFSTLGRIIITGNDTILTQKDHESRLNIDEVILVKDYGILLGASALSRNNSLRRCYRILKIRSRETNINIDLPQNIQRLVNIS